MGLFFQGRVGHLGNETDHSLDAFQHRVGDGLGIGTSTADTLSLSAVIHLLLKTMQTDGGDDTAVFRPTNNFMSTFVNYTVDSSEEIFLTRWSQSPTKCCYKCIFTERILTVILKANCLTCVSGDVSPPPGPSQVPAVPGRRHLEAQTDQVNPSSLTA